MARDVSSDGAYHGRHLLEVTNPELAVLRLHSHNAHMGAAKALAFPDASGHPDCPPALPHIPAGPARLVFGGAAEDLGGLALASPIAAAVLTLEPVAYQVKGEFAGLRASLGRRLGVIDVREAYSACPPLPGQRLPGSREGPREVP